MNTEKFCIDCKHCVVDLGAFHRCLRPTGIDVVTGRPRLLDRSCGLERDESPLFAWMSRSCGQSARHWAPADKTKAVS